MGFPPLVFLVIATAISTVNSNIEGDILHTWRTALSDPDEALSSWDPSLINPCTWDHVTCSNDGSVLPVDLGNAGLSGPLIPSLAKLGNLQYLQIAGNNISGEIPRQMGKLKSIISLGLNHNHLSGSIPLSFGKLRSLRFLRLDGNHLSGTIPVQVIQLIQRGNLQLLNVSNNHMAGTISNTGGNEGYATTTIVQDLRATK